MFQKLRKSAFFNFIFLAVDPDSESGSNLDPDQQPWFFYNQLDFDKALPLAVHLPAGCAERKSRLKARKKFKMFKNGEKTTAERKSTLF
jgi:hypothetical protein